MLKTWINSKKVSARSFIKERGGLWKNLKSLIKPLIPKPFTFWQMIGEIKKRHQGENFKTIVGVAIAAAVTIISVVYTMPIVIEILVGVGVSSLFVPDNLAQIIPSVLLGFPLFILTDFFPPVAFAFALLGILNIAFVYANAIDDEVIKAKTKEATI